MDNSKSSMGWWIGGVVVLLVIIVGAVVMKNTVQAPAFDVQQMPQVPSADSVTPTTSEATTTTASSTPTTSTVKSYTLAEVALHAKVSDCWTVISGKVYDITNAITDHPGGEAIIGGCGIDGTVLFTTRNDGTPHPRSAQKDLAKYYIADLKK